MEGFKKPFLDVYDIMELCKCAKNKAYEYIRAIKSVSDYGKTAGRVMVRDYMAWAFGDYAQKQKIREEN